MNLLDQIFLRSLDVGLTCPIGLWTTLAVIAIIAIVATAVLGVVSAFTPPKPGRISFGAVGGADGPRYGSFGPLDNTISNDLCVPVLYGRVKLAGNVIWQTDPGEQVSRIIGLCEGEILSISDVRANDNVIDDINTPGSNYTAYLGTATQKADSRVSADLRPDLELHNLAYLALTLKAGDKIKGGNPTITSICRGTLVEVFRDGSWTTAKEYSRNPVACVRDFIINKRYGLGFPKENLADDVFGQSYNYCEELITGTGADQADRRDRLFLHFDGPDGSTTAVDSSTLNHTGITFNGNAQIKTDQFKNGGASLSLDGVGDYLTVPNGSDYRFVEESELTFEMYFRIRNGNKVQHLFNFYTFASNDNFYFYVNASNQLVCRIEKSGAVWFEVTGTTVLQTGEWYKVAFTKSGATGNVYLNDSLEATGSVSSSFPDLTNGTFFIGASNSGSGVVNFFDGWIDDFRVSAGVDRYAEGDDDSSTFQPRYRLDYVIDSKRPAQDVLNDMLATFGGFLVYAGSKIKLRIEKPENVTQYFGDGSTTAQNATFDPNNIVKDSMSWNFPSVDDRPNRVKIQWVDPTQNYVKVYTQVDDWIDQTERNIVIEKEIALLGITRASQASRMAKVYMTKFKYTSANVQFSARLESIHCEVGDVIAITHQASMWTRKLMRISDMQEAEDETIRFTCSEYNASIYDDRPGASVTVQQQPSGPNLYAPLSDVQNLTAREDNFKNKDGVFVVNILLSWDALPEDQLMRLDYYLIQYSEDGGVNFKDAGFASPQKTDFRVVLGNVETLTSFVLRVKTVSDRGAESVGTNVLLDVSGKVTPPANVEDFDVSFKDDHVEIDWSAIDDADLYGYEIRVGNENSVWETAAIITTESAGTHYNHFAITRGTKKYFIKAIDNSGNYSEVAAVDTILISNIVGSNVVATFDAWSRNPVRQGNHPLFGTLSGNKYTGPASCVRFNGVTHMIEVIAPTNQYFISNTNPATSQSFCWETFVYFDNAVSSQGNLLMGKRQSGALFTYFYIEKHSSNSTCRLVFETNNGGIFSTFFNFTPTQWNHLAFSREVDTILSKQTFRFFVNGEKIYELAGALVAFIPSLSVPFRVNNYGTGSSVVGPLRFPGRFQELRVSVGTPRYTNSFTLPTAPFEPDSNTSLLLHMSEGYGKILFDSSANKVNGYINVEPFDYTGGFLPNKADGLSKVPSSEYNQNYRRIALQTCTQNTFFDYQNQGLTFAQFQATSFRFGEEEFVTSEEYWDIEPIDLGGVVTANYILELLSSSTTNLGFVTAQIATSNDGITYSDFTQFAAGQYTARFVKFRFKLQSITARAIAKLISATLVVDAPDKEQNFLNQAIGSGGTVINLSGFFSVQNIIITTVGQSNLTPRIHDQSNLPDSFEVRLFDITGALQAGNVNINVKGY